MPIPKPRKEQNKEEFIAKCMANKAMQEYPAPQRYAICLSQWRNKNK